MSANSHIMKEFWGIASGYIKAFALGFVIGVFTCIYNRGDAPKEPLLDVEEFAPPAGVTPGYIPPEFERE